MDVEFLQVFWELLAEIIETIAKALWSSHPGNWMHYVSHCVSQLNRLNSC